MQHCWKAQKISKPPSFTKQQQKQVITTTITHQTILAGIKSPDPCHGW